MSGSLSRVFDRIDAPIMGIGPEVWHLDEPIQGGTYIWLPPLSGSEDAIEIGVYDAETRNLIKTITARRRVNDQLGPGRQTS